MTQRSLPPSLIVACATGLWLTLMLPCQLPWCSTATAQIGPEKKADGAKEPILLSQIFVPPPRELVRPLARAKKAIEQQEYRQAAELLGQILTTVEQEDFLKPLDDKPHLAVSIHREAQQLLGLIPKKFRTDYELKYAIVAEQALREAVSRGDFDQLARICRHYFYTPAGYTAAMLLGHHYFEKGQPVSAAAYFSPVVSHPDARAENDPEASVMLATCWLMSRSPDKAQQILIDLKRRYPGGSINFQGQDFALFENESVALTWLTDLIGSSPISGYGPVNQWLMFRGNAQRNAESGTGFLLAFPRWYVPTINDPMHEDLAHQVFQQRLANHQVVIPSLQPLAVGDTIVTRSADRLIGVNFKTGKRVWVFPAWDPESMLDEDEQAEAYRRSQTTQWHIDQRIWKDHLYGQISSDGQLVFVIDRPGFAGRALDSAVLGRGRVIDHPLGVRDTNELKAVELARQGAFRWEVGGNTGGDEPKLAGCFFLGPPLPLQGELYALCEMSGEMRLVVLDAQTGRLNWSQQIAAIDTTMPVNKDSLRRLAGATPSFSDGILVCPTSASGVVAIELATRSMLWGFRYPANRDLRSNRNLIRVQPERIESAMSTIPVDSSVTISNGRVIVMPVDSSRVFCLDLLSGNPCWGDTFPEIGVPRNDAVMVASVSDEQVVLVGNDSLVAIDIGTGKSNWRLELGANGQPSGRGFLTGDHYFLPTTQSKLLKFHLRDGKLVDAVDTDRILGNLICYAGNVVSQGSDVLAVYRQEKPAREFVERSIHQGELSADVLVLKAQLEAQSGNLAQATETADRAFQLSGAESHLLLLVELILDLMTTDYDQSQYYVDRYAEELVTNRRHEFLAAQLQGLITTGKRQAAIDLLITLANDDHDVSTDNQGKTVYRQGADPSVHLRLDHWLRWQFTNLLDDRSTAPDPRNEDKSKWLEDQSSKLTLQGIERLADWYGPERIPPALSLSLARRQIEQQHFLQAERNLRALLESEQPELAGPATALYSKLLLESGWVAQATEYGKQLLNAYADVSVYELENGQTLSGREFYEQMLMPESTPPVDWNSWARGTITSQYKRTDANRFLSYRMVLYPKCISKDSLAAAGLKATIDINTFQLTVFDSFGQEIGGLSFKPQESLRRIYYPRDQRMSGTYSLHGHLMLFSLGYHIVAVDLFRLKLGQEAILWRKSTDRKTGQSAEPLRSALMQRQVTNPWGDDWHLFYDRDGNEIGGYASTGNRVYFQLAETIHCVDAISGEVIWKRSGTTGKRKLIADDDKLIALEAAKTQFGKFKSATILAGDAGTLLKKVDLDPIKNHFFWRARGSWLIMFSSTRKEQELTVFDALLGETVWSKTFPKDTLGCFRDLHTFAVYKPDGEFQLIDIRRGRVSNKLPMGKHRAKSLAIMPLTGNDLIVLNANSKTTSRSASNKFGANMQALGPFESLSNGYLYCLDHETQRLRWQSPLRIQSFWIPRIHPSELPIMTFARVVSNSVKGTRHEFYSVDLRDGRLVHVFRKEKMPFRGFALQASPENQTLELKFGRSTLTLQLSEAEIPPTAPASLTNEFTLGSQTIGQKLTSQQQLDNIKQRQINVLDRLIEKRPRIDK